MPENIPATPGWTDSRLDTVFASLPETPELIAAREDYETCLAGRKAPSTPSDMLGAEFNGCREALRAALRRAGIEDLQLAALDSALEAVEAEIAIGS